MLEDPNIELVSYLWESDPTFIMKSDEYDNLPVHYAARYCKSLSVIKKLISFESASLKTQCYMQKTPLHLACEYSMEYIADCIFNQWHYIKIKMETLL